MWDDDVIASASSSHSLMPIASVTKTTSVIGRNVPVPRRWMVNGGCAEATASRCFSTAGSVSVATSVGPSRVTCAGV